MDSSGDRLRRIPGIGGQYTKQLHITFRTSRSSATLPIVQ